MFQEQVFSIDVATPDQRALALDYCPEGDTLIVTKVDRLAHSSAHLLEIVETLQGKDAALRILDMSLDTWTANGRLLSTILGGIAQFERVDHRSVGHEQRPPVEPGVALVDDVQLMLGRGVQT